MVRSIAQTKTKRLVEKERIFTILGVRVRFSPKVFRELLRNFVFGMEIETTFEIGSPIDDLTTSDIPDWMWDEYYEFLRDNNLEDWEYTIWDFVEEFYYDYFDPNWPDVVWELTDYLKVEPYNDPSCGAEFPTRTFRDIREFYKTVVNVVKIIENYGYDPMEIFDPNVPVGGHFNFSNDIGYLHKKMDSYHWLLLFAGINTYLNADPRHDDRSNYNRFSYDVDEKFTAIHRKDYAVELRYFDGLTFPVSYTLNAVVNLVLFAFWWSIMPVDRDRLYRKLTNEQYDMFSRVLYNTWTKYGKDKWADVRISATNSYKLLTTILSKIDRYVREEWGISPLKGIRFQWLRGSPAIRVNELDDYDAVKFYENQLARVMGLPPIL